MTGNENLLVNAIRWLRQIEFHLLFLDYFQVHKQGYTSHTLSIPEKKLDAYYKLCVCQYFQ